MAIKLNNFIDIVSTAPVKDSEGFVSHSDSIIASVRACYEQKNSTEKWRNNAVFAEATAMFRFRVIPSIVVDTTMIIVHNEKRYNIISAEDVRRRGRYIEVFAKKIEGSS
jgi:head-tail adaptor